MLNYKFSIKVFLVVFLLSVVNGSLLISKTYAHLVGQPPYFKINGVYTSLYPVPTISIDNFDLPQDIAPASFLVGENINFEMDITQLPAPPDIVKQTNFYWHYGDGGNDDGLKSTHKYLKPGSYIFAMDAKFGNTEPQFLQSVLLNIIPEKNYKLPQIKIIANGRESKDPLTDVLKVDFRYPVTFEARSNRTDIKEYIWDFGDSKRGTGQKISHQYESGLNQIFPVVRIKTKDGFIADDYLQINNQLGATPVSPIQKKPSFWNKYQILIILGLLLITILICVVIYRVLKINKK